MKQTHKKNRRTLLSACAMAAITWISHLPTMALADSWPAKPIKVIVNFPPGGAADLPPDGER